MLLQWEISAMITFNSRLLSSELQPVEYGNISLGKSRACHLVLSRSLTVCVTVDPSWMSHGILRGTRTMSYWPAKRLGVFIRSLQDPVFLSQTLFFFPEFFFLCKRKGNLGLPACTNLSASVSADICKLPWRVIKNVPITAGEMTELPLNMVFPSRTRRMAQSQMLLHALASVLLTGLVHQEQGLWLCWAGSVAVVIQRCLVGSAEVHWSVEERCGAHLHQIPHGNVT